MSFCLPAYLSYSTILYLKDYLYILRFVIFSRYFQWSSRIVLFEPARLCLHRNLARKKDACVKSTTAGRGTKS